jgi:hypothetical protein
VVDCRTDGGPGRDEKDVGVRSCSCGVAEKKNATRTAHGTRGKLTRVRNLVLYGMGALLGCARARMVHPPPEIVQFQVFGVQVPMDFGTLSTEAGSCYFAAEAVGFSHGVHGIGRYVVQTVRIKVRSSQSWLVRSSQ